MDDCIFCKIARGDIPSRKVYEDDQIYAFHDIHPIAPVHFMIIPKRHIASLMAVAPGDEAALGRMLYKANELAVAQGLGEGFRTIINTGRIGNQEVYHLHMHVVGGPEPLGSMISRRHT